MPTYFDFFSSFSVAPPAASNQELDIFGSLSAPDSANSMALVTLPSGITSSEADMPINSGFGTNSVAPSTSSATVNQVYLVIHIGHFNLIKF